MTEFQPSAPIDTADFEMISVVLGKYFDPPPPDPAMLELLLRLKQREGDTV